MPAVKITSIPGMAWDIYWKDNLSKLQISKYKLQIIFNFQCSTHNSKPQTLNFKPQTNIQCDYYNAV